MAVWQSTVEDMVNESRSAGRAYRYWIIVILVLAFALRLVIAAHAPHPGIADPNHYYNLAQNLREGRGFVIDYIWQYHHPPGDVTHPIDHWMPLTAVWPALSQAVFGETLLTALLPSVVVGGLLPLLAWYIAGRLGAGGEARLFALVAAACIPEFILNSARTDTTIFYIWFVVLALLALYHQTSLSLFLSGLLAGLAHLTRQDGLLLLVVFACYLLLYRRSMPWRRLWLVPAGYLLVFGPWMLRNAAVLGELMPSGVSRSLFLTTIIDQYSYAGEFTLQTYLDWGLGNIIGKRLFEAAASVKLIYTLPGAVLSAAAAVGLVGMVSRRERDRLRLLSLPLLVLAGFFSFYTMLTPFLSQGGSFKKSYMALIPFLIGLGAVALERHIVAKWARRLVMVFVCGMLLLDGLVLVKNDFAHTAGYLNTMQQVGETLRDAGDVNGDGEIIIMAQDPFMLNYLGFRALMIPNDPLDVILEVAARYGADYIMMPPARIALEPVYLDRLTDPRLTQAAALPGTPIELYRVNID